jgi:predicted HD phosphohydrolase
MQSSNRQSADAGDFLAHLASLFASHDANLELDGRLSNSAHMLQTAAAAEAAGAQASLVAAALLHDIGHWLRDESIDAQSMDRRHELVGARYLAAFFGDDVTRPITLHVAAKRYLCAREPDYFASLTPGSVRSLALQGGPMSETQATAFEALPYHDRAVALRRWDEYGKVPELEVAGFGHYRALLQDLMQSHARASASAHPVQRR